MPIKRSSNFSIRRSQKAPLSVILRIRSDVASSYASECNADVRTCAGKWDSCTAVLGHIRNASELVNYLCACSGAGTAGKRRACWDHNWYFG